MSYDDLIKCMAEAKFCEVPVELDEDMLQAYKEATSTKDMDQIDKDVDFKVRRLRRSALRHRNHNTKEYVEALNEYEEILNKITDRLKEIIDSSFKDEYVKDLKKVRKLGVDLDNFEANVVSTYTQKFLGVEEENIVEE